MRFAGDLQDTVAGEARAELGQQAGPLPLVERLSRPYAGDQILGQPGPVVGADCPNAGNPLFYANRYCSFLRSHRFIHLIL